MTNKLRRAVFGAPQVGSGVDHPLGSRFALLSADSPGILKLDLDPTWIGKTLKFKFPAFNVYGGGAEALADVPAYDYTPTGIPGGVGFAGVTYEQTPQIALSQTDATHIAMAAVDETLSTGQTLHYNARTFAISDPGGTPTVYYVTIEDPNLMGDTGTSTDRTPHVDLTDDKVGAQGYIYIGFIQANHTPSAAVAGPGGWPIPQIFMVGG